MGYQLYEILVLFAIYSILGWIAETFGFALSGRGYQNRGICRGPYLPSYGLGALAVVYGAFYIKSSFSLSGQELLAADFGLGFAAAVVIGFLAKWITNGLCGEKIIRIRWYQPFLCGFAAVILVVHLHPLLSALIQWISPWIHLLFLLAFWLKFLSDLIDGLWTFRRYKKKKNMNQSAGA